MFYSRRKRIQELAEREAAGESFWTQELDATTRGRLIHAVNDVTDHDDLNYPIFKEARRGVLKDEGIFSLSGELQPDSDVRNCMATSDSELVFSILEAVSAVVSSLDGSVDIYYEMQQHLDEAVPRFESDIRTIFREERVSFDFVDGKIVPFESLEMHEEVVVPAISLLGGDPKYGSIERAYMDALDELHTGTPGDAITDAGTALQECLKYLDCQGNALGPLIKSAKKKKLLAPHDSPLVDGILSVMDWVSADRSELGDSHRADNTARENAWLTVHVVGALILRLLRGEPRNTS